MSSNKQNIDFYLPSLINNHKFQQIFYHHNKLIVYDSSSSNKQAAVTPKTIEILQRPKTSASISNKLSNRLTQARSKASIDKFISTHKRIQEEKKKTQISFLPKKKYNRNLIKKTQVSKLQTIRTQNQSVKRDQPIFTQISEAKDLNVPLLNASIKKLEILEPQEKLIKQIVEKTHASQRKSARISVRQINSVDRNQSRKSINFKSSDQNNVNAILSASRQKTLDHKAKNPQMVRKSVTMNSKDAQKAHKSNLSSFSNFSSKAKSKKVLNQQPQINEQKVTNSEPNLENKIQDPNEWLQKLFNPIYTLYGQKDLYQRKQCDLYTENMQIPNFFGVLPRECFFSTQTEKRRSYIDNRINHLERKIHEQEDIIKHQDEQINELLLQKNQLLKDSNAFEDSQVSKLQLKSQQKPNTHSKSIKLSSIQEENQNPNEVEEDQINQKTLKQEIESLNLRTLSNQHFLQNKSKFNVSNVANQNQNSPFLADSVSNHFQTKLLSTQPKKVVLTSRIRQKQNIFQIQQNCLKRAQIVKFLPKQYVATVKGLYWVLINQRENAYLMKRNDTKDNQNSQSLKYIKEFHKNRNQMIQESSIEYGQNQNQERIFVDKEFLHETIQISDMKEQIHWLYFKPCTQSSIFPSELKLPQHYITTESDSPSINSLVSLLNCILNLNPTFIERILEPTYNNVFSCWLNKNGQFEPTYVDGYMPYNGKLNSFLTWSEEFLWIGILLKCCAKLFGGYHQLLKLNFDDWSRTILGRTLTTLQKPSYKQIKQWQEDEFEQKVIEYLSKYQQKHKSTLVVRHKPTQRLFLITAIKNNKIKLSHIHSQKKRLEVSLFEFIIDEHYQLILFPESPTSFFRTSEYQTYAKGNIVTYQLRVQENKSSVTICTQLSTQENVEPNFSKTKKQRHGKRRILIYEIPYPSKREKKQKSEMILKYSSDAHPYTRIFTNHQGVEILQMDLPQIKKGEYKIFIECGKIKLNDYFQSHSKTISRWLKTEDSFNDRSSPRNFNKIENENKKFKNVFSVVSSHSVGLRGGRSLIINEKGFQNELIEDENFLYKQKEVKKEENDE